MNKLFPSFPYPAHEENEQKINMQLLILNP